MAPPTGPRGNAQRSGPRTSRGGITKRRNNTAKLDRDGDVSMDAPATGNGNADRGNRGGRGGRGTRGSQTSRASTQSSRIAQNIKNYAGGPGGPGHASKTGFNRVTLKIQGLKNSKAASNPDQGQRSLLEFLERKASKDKEITIGRCAMDGDYVWISVKKDDAPDLLRLSGYSYAGAPLTITETTEPMPTPGEKKSAEAAETLQKLTMVLANRYKPAERLLDLSSLAEDPILNSMGTFGSQTLAEKSFKALLKIASEQYKSAEEKREAIQAVSLANNFIKDVDQVLQLSYSLPQLKRLDLSNNNLNALSNISKWKHKFRHLEELHVTGNPIEMQENYANELLTWYPTLQILNGQRVRTAEEASKTAPHAPLAQLPSAGDPNLANAFLQAFLPLFDNDRPRLVAEFYDEDSTFSVATIPGSERPLPWKSYDMFQTLGTEHPDTQKRLFTGSALISDVWSVLPMTRHTGVDQPGQFLVDSHVFPSGNAAVPGLMIIVNGRLEEADLTTNTVGTRSFSRTFLLGPNKTGQPHPYRVVSDQLTLHDWKQSAVVGSSPTPTVASAVLDESIRAQLIQGLSKQTGMTAQYSEMCLAGTANWNFEAALKSFEEQKANLPATAFITPP
ncbi:hypothetical protein QBC46DRAFT_371799 [Diplogelasinospora grovesii]|uniref:mRNA export factor MEX67 n=1 Tax=Diplogelasinospora grovesii TaxID=303347 RepID=A0AAN6NGF0_9PEZI|nr:hypothetical protein QBC46DRAFT_371799 [Diplogelasinospora grovesii]